MIFKDHVEICEEYDLHTGLMKPFHTGQKPNLYDLHHSSSYTSTGILAD